MLVPGLISALVTVRDGEAHLGEALDSLLAQTDGAFEVVVVDDGSTDGTPDVLEAHRDARLAVHRIPATGRAAALCYGIGVSRGELVAVLDADDIALPGRLAIQRQYLAEHPEVALLASAAIEFGDGPERVEPVPTGPRQVRRALGMYNPIYHSSVMFRREAYEAVGGYQPSSCARSEDFNTDFAFLVRVTCRYAVDILPHPLIRYRRHPSQMTVRQEVEDSRRRYSARLQLRAACQLGLPPHLWCFPLLGWAYTQIPGRLRPRHWKDPMKQALLRLVGIRKTAYPRLSRRDVRVRSKGQEG